MHFDFFPKDTATRQTDRKRDSEQMAAGSSDDQPAAIAANDSTEKSSAGHKMFNIVKIERLACIIVKLL